ncbi:helix-turn-helix domain-containing protein [Pseudomonas aeruginosa]|uniref:helix-turn-helix domain-containing protein n=2 Tax=Pseudomonas aeruginosa TaxID=287 RepID=UPI00280C23B5|nr:helix-turn-helix domain-containing protein [Pseudomonas aeruginosa]
MCCHICGDTVTWFHVPHSGARTESRRAPMSHQQAIGPLSVGVEEGARLIGVARSMFYEILARGEVESFKLGRRRLVLVRDLEAFINRQARENSR